MYLRLPNPTAYSGAYKLLRAVRGDVKKEDVEKWLEHHEAYNFHKPVRHKYPRRMYIVDNIDDVWEGDLADFRSIRTYNDGFSYILICIDVLSKYAFAEPIKDKTSKSVTDAFERILERSDNRLPVCFQSDRGKEFIGKDFQDFLKRYNITFRATKNPEIKAAVAERFLRTLKQNIWRYFSQNRTRRYIDILEQIIESYNRSWHSGIRMIPREVDRYNAHVAFNNLKHRYQAKTEKRKCKFGVGDHVRISRKKSPFDKGYESGWTRELFKIVRVSRTREPPVYYLTDLQDEPLDTFFYEEELSRVREKETEPNEYEIDEILDTRVIGKVKQHLVSWKGYPEKFNCWIPANNIKKI